jgi:hypothetical protein
MDDFNATKFVNRALGLDRRHFIGGSGAQFIMGQDEKALIRLWQEKRGEVAPEATRRTLSPSSGYFPKPQSATPGMPSPRSSPVIPRVDRVSQRSVNGTRRLKPSFWLSESELPRRHRFPR